MTSSDYTRERIFSPGEYPVHVDVTQLKDWKVATGYGPFYHSEYEIHLIRHGAGRYFIGDTNYSSEKNSVFIIHNNEVHCYMPDLTSSVKNMSLIFAPRIITDRPVARAAMRSLESIHHLVLSDKQAAMAELLLSEIANESKDNEMNWQRVVAHQIEIFLIVLQRAAAQVVTDSKNKDPLIQEIIQYLDATFADRLSLVDVAARFYMSSFTLSKKFKQYVGFGFREYLIHRRIVEAQRLLGETDMKVASIAYKVGFESMSAFNSNFLRLTGITPAVYRKLTLIENPL